MRHYLWQLRPYFRQVAGELVLGSIAGIVMNTAVVLPAILLGRAIDTALALSRGQATLSAVGWAALAFVGGTLLSEGPRMLKRWWLMTANARIRANVRADAVRGILALPLADLHQTPIGDLMARIIGDVEVLGVGVREFIIETWDTVLFSLSLIVAMLVYDAGLTALVLLATILMGFVLLALRRWRLPLGTFTLIFTVNGALMSVLLDQQRLIPGVFLAGVFADLLYRIVQPAAQHVAALRLFALCVPLVYFLGYFVTLMLTGGTNWSIHLWLAASVMTSIISLTLSYLLALPASPVTEAG